MRLDNEFEVPRPVDEAWAVLTDVERIAPCLPGAQLTEVDGDVYHGIVKVKVGPVTAQYAGEARFTEMDAERHHVVLSAKGKERTGKGLANALVTADLHGSGDTTRVTVSTDLTISGPLAQFGRGAIAEVSTKLLNQFVANLRETVLDAPQTAAGTATPAPAAPAETAPAAPAEAAPVGTAPATAGGPQPDTGTPQPSTRRVITGPEAQAVDVLAVARGSILKRVIPLVVVVAVVVVLVVWLA